MATWYRVLVAFMAVAMAFCTAGMVYAGCELWQAGQAQTVRWREDGFQWNNGLYDVSGRLDGGVLDELIVRRVRLTLEEQP